MRAAGPTFVFDVDEAPAGSNWPLSTTAQAFPRRNGSAYSIDFIGSRPAARPRVVAWVWLWWLRLPDCTMPKRAFMTRNQDLTRASHSARAARLARIVLAIEDASFIQRDNPAAPIGPPSTVR